MRRNIFLNSRSLIKTIIAGPQGSPGYAAPAVQPQERCAPGVSEKAAFEGGQSRAQVPPAKSRRRERVLRDSTCRGQEHGGIEPLIGCDPPSADVIYFVGHVSSQIACYSVLSCCDQPTPRASALPTGIHVLFEAFGRSVCYLPVVMVGV